MKSRPTYANPRNKTDQKGYALKRHVTLYASKKKESKRNKTWQVSVKGALPQPFGNLVTGSFLHNGSPFLFLG